MILVSIFSITLGSHILDCFPYLPRAVTNYRSAQQHNGGVSSMLEERSQATKSSKGMSKNLELP